jgi:hypothetical protein
MDKMGHWITGIVLAAIMALMPACHADVTFAHLSDTHLMRQGPDGSWLLLKDAPALFADMLNQLEGKAQFVVLTGNAVHSPDEWDTLTQLVAASRVPVYVCLGNRDVAHDGKLAAIQRLNQLNPQSFTLLDRGYYSFSPAPGVRLLMLDTAGNSTGKGQIDPDQQAWLKQQLAAELNNATPSTLVVAMHHPLVEPYASPSRRLPDSTRQAVLGTLEQSPLVGLVLSGAYHAAKLQRRNGVLHVSTPALAEYPAAARLITLKDNGQVELAWLPTRLQTLAQLSRSRSPWVGVSNGSPAADHQWQGALRYYPTPAAVARVKQAVQTANSKAKPQVKTPSAVVTKPQKPPTVVNMLPKPAPIMLQKIN